VQFVLGFFVFLLPVSSGFCLVLDHRLGRMGGLGGKVGSVCEEFEGNEGGVLGLCF